MLYRGTWASNISLGLDGNIVFPLCLWALRCSSRPLWKVPSFFVLQYLIERDMPLPVAEVHVTCLVFLGFFSQKAHHERVLIVVCMGVKALTALLLNFCWHGLLCRGAISIFVSASLFPCFLLVDICFCQSCFRVPWS